VVAARESRIRNGFDAHAAGFSASAADLEELMEKLPEGLHTSLGEGGALISGGEGQRVRLGRALLRPAGRLVILDEPSAAEADFHDAEEIVRALGLSDLLTKMPAGLLQMVGEGGWQLSHRERSRLYMARALLQGGQVMIFDESFAALDPENLRQALGCVLRRAPTLMVIAHP
jgi:ABC-type transport system involved in cytochrome bd biosynthesis fused ATPase/permease subunit